MKYKKIKVVETEYNNNYYIKNDKRNIFYFISICVVNKIIFKLTIFI